MAAEKSSADAFGTDFGRNPSASRRTSYAVAAFFPVLLASFLFIRLYVLNLAACKVTIIAGVALGTALLSISYHQLAFAKSARLRNEVKPPAKNAYKSRKAYDEAAAAHERDVDLASFLYSYFYNNIMFLVGIPFFGLYLIGDKVSGDLAFVISAGLAGALTLFNSKSALKAIGET